MGNLVARRAYRLCARTDGRIYEGCPSTQFEGSVKWHRDTRHETSLIAPPKGSLNT